jgi:uncharacterized protein YcbK (DUF882 family)
MNAIVLLLASLLGALHGVPTPGGERPLLLSPAHEEAADAPTWPITFFFENRQESLPIALFDAGALDAISRDALDALSHHVRCFRTDQERLIHPRLVEVIARVTEAFGRDHVDVISGYRARPFGAPHSRHFLGHAMDLRLPNIPSKKVAAWVWKNFRGVGVGYYPKQNFVHIDVRDVDVRWVDTSLEGESANARYFPRTPSEQALPTAAPVLLYDQPRTPAVSTTSVALLSSPAASGIRGAE